MQPQNEEPILLATYQSKRKNTSYDDERPNEMNNAAVALPAVPEQQKGAVVSMASAGRNDLTSLSLGQAMRVAESLYKSGYFDKIKNPDQAFAKILAGQEYGLAPMQALAFVHIVEGKPTLDATMIRARIKSSGKYDVKTVSSTDKGCTLRFFEHGKVLGDYTFEEEDAKRAGVFGKNNWTKYPKAMYLARATTGGAREHCPDVFGGPIYTPEELSDGDVMMGSARESNDLPTTASEPKNVTHTASPETPRVTPTPSDYVVNVITKHAIPEETVSSLWLDLIGDSKEGYPTWDRGEVDMLRDFAKALLAWAKAQREVQVAPETQAEPTPEPQLVAETKAETPEDVLDKDLDSFASPKVTEQLTRSMIDPQIIEEFRGLRSPSAIKLLCATAEGVGLSGSDLRDIVKKAIGDAEALTQVTYDKVMSTLQQMPRKT